MLRIALPIKLLKAAVPDPARPAPRVQARPERFMSLVYFGERLTVPTDFRLQVGEMRPVGQRAVQVGQLRHLRLRSFIPRLYTRFPLLGRWLSRNAASDHADA